MQSLPVGDPGTPDRRSATRFLLWLAARHRAVLLTGMLLGVVWMVAQALMPAAIGAAIDAGLTDRDPAALLRWGLVLLGLAVLQAVAGILRHRCVVFNWLAAAYRTVQFTV